MSSGPSRRSSAQKASGGKPVSLDEGGTTGNTKPQVGPQYRPLKPHPSSVSRTDASTQSGKRVRIAEPSSAFQARRTNRDQLQQLAASSSDPGYFETSSERNGAPVRSTLLSARAPFLTANSEPVHTLQQPHPALGWQSAPAGALRNAPAQTQHSRPRQYFPFRHPKGLVQEQNTELQPCLLGLPMETRYRIYKLLLVQSSSLQLSTKQHVQSFAMPALLHVNKQIRQEASHIWYGLNHFILTVRHGETALVHDFLLSIANLDTTTPVQLDITLNTCFQCNDLVGVAAILISCKIRARIKCIRRTYHVGHPQVGPCKFNVAQAIMDQNIRPSVATALLQNSDQRFPGAGFVVEESPAESFISGSTSTATRESAVLGYTPMYNVNMWIREDLENAMGSVGLLLQ